jgi:hypothetical protein
MDSKLQPRPARLSRLLWRAGTLLAIGLVFGTILFFRHAKRKREDQFLREVMLIQEALAQFSLQTGGRGQKFHPVRSVRVPEEATDAAIEGQWRIQRSEGGSRDGITEFIIENPNRSLQEMVSLDAAVDDGDLSSGNFTLRGRNSYSIRLLEEDIDVPKNK